MMKNNRTREPILKDLWQRLKSNNVYVLRDVLIMGKDCGYLVDEDFQKVDLSVPIRPIQEAEVRLDTPQLKAGFYFCRIKNSNVSQSLKVLKLSR